MVPESIISLSENPEDVAKAYPRVLFEIAKGNKLKILNTLSAEQLIRFIKAAFEELKPHLN